MVTIFVGYMLTVPIIYKKRKSVVGSDLTHVFSKMAPWLDVRGASRDYGDMSTWLHVDGTNNILKGGECSWE